MTTGIEAPIAAYGIEVCNCIAFGYRECRTWCLVVVQAFGPFGNCSGGEGRMLSDCSGLERGLRNCVKYQQSIKLMLIGLNRLQIVALVMLLRMDEGFDVLY